MKANQNLANRPSRNSISRYDDKFTERRRVAPEQTSPRSRYRVAPAHWVVLCGSMSFYAHMLSIQAALSEAGVRSLLPTPEDPIRLEASPIQYLLFKRKLSLEHINRIRHPSSYGVLLLNYSKRGIEDYVGPNTFAEAAIAISTGKKIFVLNSLPTLYEDELLAWGATPINGSLKTLIHSYHADCSTNIGQLSLFPDEM